jgi:hypothetical protein
MRNKWLTARYAAQREEIEQRYAQHEIVGEPEVRHLPDDWRYADASRLASTWYILGTAGGGVDSSS